MKLINHKSDFDFIFRARDRRGREIDLTATNWEARFWTSSKSIIYQVSKRGYSLTNCVIDKSGAIRAVFDSHKLPVGQLNCELTVFTPDELYPDGTRQSVTPDMADITLVSGKGDAPDDIDDILVDVSLPLLKGDKGDPMTWSGLSDEQRQEIIDAVSKEIPIEAEPEAITEEDIKALLDKV